MIIQILTMSEIDPFQRVMLFVVLVSALLFALTLHEFAHAFVALLNGDRTAKMNGRVSLNPMRHLDPVGFMMMMVVGYGFAKPVPVNVLNFKKRRLGFFTVSIAGVATNLVLAVISSGIFMALVAFSPLGANSFLMIFLGYFQSLNLILCFFNLLPFFPLDGFNVLVSILRHDNKLLVFLRKYGYYILLALIVLPFLLDLFLSFFSGGQEVGDVSILRYFDVLGLYFEYTAGKVLNGLLWLWGKIFGL